MTLQHEMNYNFSNSACEASERGRMPKVRVVPGPLRYLWPWNKRGAPAPGVPAPVSMPLQTAHVHCADTPKWVTEKQDTVLFQLYFPFCSALLYL